LEVSLKGIEYPGPKEREAVPASNGRDTDRARAIREHTAQLEAQELLVHILSLHVADRSRTARIPNPALKYPAALRAAVGLS